MARVRFILAVVFGGAWGFSLSRFAIEGDWAMTTLVIGLFAAIFYLSCWIIECWEVRN